MTLVNPGAVKSGKLDGLVNLVANLDPEAIDTSAPHGAADIQERYRQFTEFPRRGDNFRSASISNGQWRGVGQGPGSL